VPQPVRPVLPKTIDAVIVVDPGHGGKDPGAKGVSPILEKDLVLSIARNLEGQLDRRGAEVIMTRTGDGFLELDDRAAIAERHDADLFVSIHADSAPRRSASGFTVYIARAASTESFRAANRIERAFRKAGFTSRGIRRADFRVLAGHSRPAVLFEAGYLTNPTDARRLCDPTHRARIARILADAIVSLFK
jgi:N-acetylmuramoyl-L-alanine amidase